jgi:hypothetical protein
MELPHQFEDALRLRVGSLGIKTAQEQCIGVEGVNTSCRNQSRLGRVLVKTEEIARADSASISA